MRRLIEFTGKRQLAAAGTLLALVGLLAAGSLEIRGQSEIRGAWQAETYILRDGPRHPLGGTIFFTESDWTVLFFVLDENGEPQRGSAEGGTYTLEGDRLTFLHYFNLSGGEAVEGLAASEWSMRVRETGESLSEPCTVELSDQRLTIHFPSGNQMVFSRSSR